MRVCELSDGHQNARMASVVGRIRCPAGMSTAWRASVFITAAVSSRSQAAT